MKIHEYQAKSVLARFGVPVPRGEVAFTPAEAGEIAKRLGGNVVVVKAQIHAGGRGKGGGVKIAKSPDEAEQLAKQMIGMTLVTHQTGPEGKKVGRVLIEEGLQIDRELYLSILIDRAAASPGHHRQRRRRHGHRGGRGEGAGEDSPRAHRPRHRHRCRSRRASWRSAWGLSGAAASKLVKLLDADLQGVHRDRRLDDRDQSADPDQGRRSAGARRQGHFDDNALYRHPDLRELRDITEEDPLEVEASKFSLNYIRLDGNIGCMVNGAGLAMATMDIIKLAGGEPANFLDVGGGANAEQIKNAFRILMADKNVKAVLINIFGGILRCDVLAQGVIAAVKELGVPVPIVIRMEGTNVEEGKRMLRESGLNFTTADSMGEAAEKVVALGEGSA